MESPARRRPTTRDEARTYLHEQRLQERLQSALTQAVHEHAPDGAFRVAELLVSGGVGIDGEMSGTDALARRGQLDKARDVLESALEIEQHHLGLDDPLLAARCAELAQLCVTMGDRERAEVLLRNSCAIAEAAGDEFCSVDAYTTLARLLMESDGRLDAAREATERAVRLVHSRFGQEHPHAAVALSDLAGASAGNAGALLACDDFYLFSVIRLDASLQCDLQERGTLVGAVGVFGRWWAVAVRRTGAAELPTLFHLGSGVD